MITNPLDYRHKTGAKRRATDARAEQRTYDSQSTTRGVFPSRTCAETWTCASAWAPVRIHF